MANGEDAAVTWKDFNKHLEESKHGFERISGLEEEVMGNEKTGRPSLRIDLTSMIESQGEKTRKTLRAVGIPIIVALILGILSALTGFHLH